jgi:transposase
LGLVKLSIVEQRYQAVMAVKAGDPVIEVAARIGVSRQSLHSWLARYDETGLAGLHDRSRRPESCPHQASPAVEAAAPQVLAPHRSRGPA